jgi:hypothetical protein
MAATLVQIVAMDAKMISSRSRGERAFYLATTAVFLSLVVWTFARTYYFKFFFHTRPLPWLLHVHGVVMTGWPVLLVLQSWLVAKRRIRWHRALGYFGARWAGLVVLMGSLTTLHAAAREVRGHTPLAQIQLAICGLELVQMILFAGFVATAVWLRRNPAAHKRLMLLTIPCMLPSALARLPGDFMTNTLILTGLYAFVLIAAGIDTYRHRRLHPAFGWGGAAVLGGLHLTFYAAFTPAYIALGTRLLG